MPALRKAAPVVLAGLLVAAVAALALLVRPPRSLSTAAALCADSPTPRLCRMLERAAGARDVPDLAADLEPPDLAQLPPLAAGREALRLGWPTQALKRCEAAAAAPGPDQREALLCAGRAAMVMGLHQRAANLARRALDLREDAAGQLLLGLALVELEDCRQARPALLRALELQPGGELARAALGRCATDPPAPPPPPADLTMRRALVEVLHAVG